MWASRSNVCGQHREGDGMPFRNLLLLGALLAVGPRAAALELGPSESPLSVEVHGFISQGVLRTTANNYLARSDSGIGSFEFTEIGINFTKSLTDRLRFGLH